MKKRTSSITYSINNLSTNDQSWREKLCRDIDAIIGVVRTSFSSNNVGTHKMEIEISFGDENEALLIQKAIMKITKRGNGKLYHVVGRTSNLSELYNPDSPG